ncbi:NAD(P)-binding protein-12 [Coleophoma cylindrospora]|uniref:NAD(P)-binding protein-12 n=1 Tax=Coleophoma cylindrospora TaxID=1849047 RepID=A0A3D8S6N2_9HELO|nr:NAD(P)-binding protein-12 [Coleophoma cylindrospora]
MRIAIAGSSGLAQVFANHLSETAHIFIILARHPKPALEQLGYQVIVVDYNSQEELRYSLRGIDLVISTVQGHAQINLIDAAAHARVRRFVPAEFEGPPVRRPSRNDPLDRGRVASLERLRHWSNSRSHPLRSTTFVCGVFYERFARGGLASLNIGGSTLNNHQGAYLMDVGRSTAEIVECHANGSQVNLCMTTVYDLAKFMIAAIELGPSTWPSEFRMQGDRLSTASILHAAETVRGVQFATTTIPANDLQAHLNYATYYDDWAEVARLNELIATEQRRYDFSSPNLNALVNVQPISFWNWLCYHWGSQ